MPRRSAQPNVHAELDRIEERPARMVAALYRRFDADGVLLYVGVSEWPYSRSIGHGVHSLWVQFAATGTTTWYATRNEAEQAEKVAIADERPLFNRYHSAPGAAERLRVYLIESGREDLLPAVAGWRWSYRERRRARPPSEPTPSPE